MGLLDGFVGGVIGAGLVSVVNDIIEKHGGLPGVVNQFESNGLGPTVNSWISSGPNQPISPDALHRVLGSFSCNSFPPDPGCICRTCHRSSRKCCRKSSMG